MIWAPIVWVGEKQNNFAISCDYPTCKKIQGVTVQSHHFYTIHTRTYRGSGEFDIGAIRNDAVSEVKANGRIMGLLLARTTSPCCQFPGGAKKCRVYGGACK
jgi:hypothetical protein